MRPKDVLIVAILAFEWDTAGIGADDLAAMRQGYAVVGALLDAPAFGDQHLAAGAARRKAMIAAAKLVHALRFWRSTGGRGGEQWQAASDIEKVADPRVVAMLFDAMRTFDKLTLGLNARALKPTETDRWDPLIPDWRVGAAACALISTLERAERAGDTTVRVSVWTVH